MSEKKIPEEYMDLIDPLEQGMGWLPDYPDYRDYTVIHPKVVNMFNQLDLKRIGDIGIKSVDLKRWCSPIEDQGNLGSCTANAGVGLVEYYERRAFNKHIDASRLFLYKVTRKLLRFYGDTGAFMRTTMGAMKLFGVPPEKYWPYRTEWYLFDREPTAFCYSFAENYKAINYVRLDPAGTKPIDLTARIKANLIAGLPSMFGFTVYSSIRDVGVDGKIPYPLPGEGVLGGHGIVAVGYDDGILIGEGDNETIGAWLIRNSWGEWWGDEGYGWLPYKYVQEGLAKDWWTLIKQAWVDTGEFGL